MSIELKIKSKHLALEAGVIRFEERKLLKHISWLRKSQQPTSKLEQKYNSLATHRKLDVRRENRATFLARAYISGKSYLSIERKVKNKYVLECYIIPRVVAMVKRYHNYKVTEEDIKNWICECSPGRGLSLPS